MQSMQEVVNLLCQHLPFSHLQTIIEKVKVQGIFKCLLWQFILQRDIKVYPKT